MGRTVGRIRLHRISKGQMEGMWAGLREVRAWGIADGFEAGRWHDHICFLEPSLTAVIEGGLRGTRFGFRDELDVTAVIQ